MSAYLPIILVLLAVFTAGCIVYVAWELSSGDAKPPTDDDTSNASHSDTKRKPRS